jgi:hypothetical protein
MSGEEGGVGVTGEHGELGDGQEPSIELLTHGGDGVEERRLDFKRPFCDDDGESARGAEGKVCQADVEAVGALGAEDELVGVCGGRDFDELVWESSRPRSQDLTEVIGEHIGDLLVEVLNPGHGVGVAGGELLVDVVDEGLRLGYDGAPGISAGGGGTELSEEIIHRRG